MKAVPIVKFPHSVLRRPAEAVKPAEISSARIRLLIADMKETLAAAADGVGLAAPQVGVRLRIFLVSEEALQIDSRVRTDAPGAQGKKRAWEYRVFINPVLKKRSRKKIEMAEGCLSVPGKFGLVPRSEKILVEWLDEHGQKHARGLTKFFARVIQHELDHLDGLLISDRARRLVTVPADGRSH